MADVALKQVRSSNGVSPEPAGHAALAEARPDRHDARAHPTPRSSRACSASSGTWSRSESDGSRTIGLHTLKPAEGSRRPRKRLGRGEGSGHGKTSGRGHKGAGARSGNKRKVGYEGGQNPIHMRMRKLRGPNKKMSMPFEQFRTRTQPVNLADLEDRFKSGDEVTPESLREAGLAKRAHPVKILARGEISKKLTVKAHGFSAPAKEKIEAAGGTCRDNRELMLQTIANAFTRPGDPQEDPVHGRDPGALPARRLHPLAGRRRQRRQGHPGATSAAPTSSASSTSSRAEASRACPCSRSGSCPTSRPRSSCSC